MGTRKAYHPVQWFAEYVVRWRQLPRARRRRWILAGLMALALATTAICAQPLLAAVQFSYFSVISNPASVVLQWGTTSELSVQGFEIQCKLADEPEAAYHRIGFMPAKGSPSTPAQYSFPVTTGVDPGAAYCFRLIEQTSDGSLGDVQDRCGYGPNVTPTPGAPGVVPTLDPNRVSAVPTDAFGNPIVEPTPLPTDSFGNPIAPPAAPTDAFGSPLPPPLPTDSFGNPIAPPAAPTDAFGSPLPPPLPTDPSGNPIAPSAQQYDQFGNPIAPQYDAFGSPLATPIPTADPLAVPTPMTIPSDPNNPSPGASALSAPTEAPSTLSQASGPATGVEEPAVTYIVVTAIPTEAPLALGAVLTPLATVTPTPAGYQLVSALAPTTQNLMIMLLCLTFTGASGIGILGLITSVMFMRSRSSQRDFYDRYSPPARRRQR